MEKDIITQALLTMVAKEGNSLQEVKDYLRMKFKMEVEDIVLSKRLEKNLNVEKAVA